MNRTFRLAIGLRITLFLVCPAVLLFGGFMFFEVVLRGEEFHFGMLLVGVTFLPLMALSLYGLIVLFVAKYIVTEDEIIEVNPFGKQSLRLIEIKGFRIDKNYIRFIPNDSSKQVVKFSTHLGDYGLMHSWASSRFDDITYAEDLKALEREKKEILSNDDFGTDPESRQAMFTEAKRISRTLNIAAVPLLLWIWMDPSAYRTAMIIGMVYPLGCLVVFAWYRGLIKFNETQNSSYPNGIAAVLLPGAGLCIRAVHDYELMDSSKVWVYMPIGALVFALLCLVISKELTGKGFKSLSNILIMTFISCMYSGSTIVIANSIFDESKSENFKATVIDRTSYSGKGTTYYLRLSPWGPRPERENVSVSREQFYHANINDVVTVRLNKGALDIPWIEIDTD